MRICDLVTGIGRLKRATSQLKDHWGETREHWSDNIRHEFEEKHLTPLPAEITLAVASIQRLAELLEQAERELQDEMEILL